MLLFVAVTVTLLTISSNTGNASAAADVESCSSWQDKKLRNLEQEIRETEALIQMNRETIARLEETEVLHRQTALNLKGHLDDIHEISTRQAACVDHDPQASASDFCIGNDYIRLVNGSSEAEGRLEVKLGEEWMSVCQTRWGKASAKLVCSILGYPGNNVVPVGSLVFGDGNATKMPSSGSCTQSAGVICGDEQSHPVRLVGGLGPAEGRVEVLMGGQWGTINSNGNYWGPEEAQVVCKMLGYDGVGATPTRGSVFGPGTGPVWLAGLSCTGSESHLLWCPSNHVPGADSDTHDHDAGVICHNWSYHAVRLVNGTNDHEGRVEVRINGQWSPIYTPAEWDANEARVVCRMLGLKWEGAEALRWPHGGGTQLMGYVKCLGTEQHILECPTTYAVGLPGWNDPRYTGGVRCPHYAHAFNSSSTIVQTKWSVMAGSILGTRSMAPLSPGMPGESGAIDLGPHYAVKPERFTTIWLC